MSIHEGDAYKRKGGSRRDRPEKIGHVLRRKEWGEGGRVCPERPNFKRLAPNGRTSHVQELILFGIGIGEALSKE